MSTRPRNSSVLTRYEITFFFFFQNNSSVNPELSQPAQLLREEHTKKKKGRKELFEAHFFHVWKRCNIPLRGATTSGRPTPLSLGLIESLRNSYILHTISSINPSFIHFRRDFRSRQRPFWQHMAGSMG